MVLDPTLLFLKFSIFATLEKMKFNIPGIFQWCIARFGTIYTIKKRGKHP